MEDVTVPNANLSEEEGASLSYGRGFLQGGGLAVLRLCRAVHGLGAFGLITLGVVLTKFNRASKVVHPLIKRQVYFAGVRLIWMVGFLAVALGLVVIGQTVSLLSRLGAQSYAGVVMVTVVVRELGPLATALLVLARAGTATVIDLGTSRALGEIEALEALGIDPIHYLVLPRVIGLATAIFSLTVYLIILALGSGFLFAFVQDVPLTLADYFSQLAASLRWEDFMLLILKTVSFGCIIALVTCYYGLARPLKLGEVSEVTTTAVVYSVVGCILLDALFIVVYLVM